jgi:hypothetical protein
MKITLLGVLAFIGIAALLIYVGGELQRKNKAKADQPPENPPSPPQNPDPSTEL